MEYLLLIRKYRKMKKLTQKELAKKAKIDQSYLSKLERNVDEISCTIRVLCDIAEALEVCASDLVVYCKCKMCKNCKRYLNSQF
jgi:Predicted transcriptional regulator with C-terminal CBS domains